MLEDREKIGQGRISAKLPALYLHMPTMETNTQTHGKGVGSTYVHPSFLEIESYKLLDEVESSIACARRLEDAMHHFIQLMLQ